MHTPQLSHGIAKRIVAGKQAPMTAKRSIEEKRNLAQQRKEEINKTKEVNNFYIYDESGNDGYCLTENMWSKSKTLKNMMTSLGWSKEVDIISQVEPFGYPSDVIKTIYDILKTCENASQEKPCSDAVKDTIAGISFQTVVSSLICADETLNIDKELLTELVKKVEQKISDLCNGKVVSTEDIQALDAMSLGSDLRKELLGIQWEIFVEKFKLSVVKKCSYTRSENQPEAYLYGDPGGSIARIAFSFDDKYLSVESYAFDQIIDVNSMDELNKLEHRVTYQSWIDNDRFVIGTPSHIAVFKCEGKKIVEERRVIPNKNISYMSAIQHQGKIVFSAWDSFTGIYIAKWDYANSNTIEYFNLRGMQGEHLETNYSKIIKIDDAGTIYMVFDSQKNSDKMGLYKIDQSDERFVAEEIEAYDGRISSVVTNRERSKFAVIVWFRDIGILSLETKSYVLFNGKLPISSLAFSHDGKLIVAACRDELSIISAITGEKIGEFARAGEQVFQNNRCVALSHDGNVMAIGREASSPDFAGEVVDYFKKLVMMPSSTRSFEPNLLMWKLLPDEYVFIFKELQKGLLSFRYIKLLVSLCSRAKDDKKPVQLTDDEKIIFEDFSREDIGWKVSNMLADIHYVSSGESIPASPAQAVQPAPRTFLQRLYDAGIAVNDALRYMIKGLR